MPEIPYFLNMLFNQYTWTPENQLMVIYNAYNVSLLILSLLIKHTPSYFLDHKCFFCKDLTISFQSALFTLQIIITSYIIRNGNKPLQCTNDFLWTAQKIYEIILMYQFRNFREQSIQRTKFVQNLPSHHI